MEPNVINHEAEYEILAGKPRAIFKRLGNSSEGECPFCLQWHKHPGDQGHRTTHCKNKNWVAYSSDGTFLDCKDGYIVRDH